MDFKVKCVAVKKYPEYFTVGKVYEAKDGKVVCDNGWVGDAWALTINGNADFEAFQKWFEPWHEFELVEEKKMFTKSDLKPGMFGVMDNGNLFVIVNDKIIYQNDGYDNIESLDDDLSLNFHKINKVYDKCYSFRHLTKLLDKTAYTAATLIYDRERDTKKPLYNGKVVCIDLNGANKHLYTVGKIYQFKDGHLTANDGTKYPGTKTKAVHSFGEWEEWTSSKFIEIKE